MFKFGKNKTHNGAPTTQTGSNNKSGIAKLAGGLPVLLLALAAWAVALAGVAVVRNEVGENPGFLVHALGFSWFVVFFSLFVLLTALIHAVAAGAGAGRKMPIGASAVAGLLAVATVLTILETRDWNDARRTTGHGNKVGKGATTAFAGFLSLAVLNGLLILILGNQHDTHRSVETKTYHNHPEAAFPTTTPVTHNTGMAHATTTTAPHHNQGVNVV